MTGFVNPDGSSLIGALLASGAGQALGLDSLGNLKVTAIDQLRAYINNGQGFTASAGIINSVAGTNNYPLAIFNPANSGKNILLYSLQATTGTGSMMALLQRVTSNPAFANAANISNSKAGGAASAIAASCTTTSVSQSIASPYDQVVVNGSGVIELLTNGSTILLPVGSANGIVLYLQTYSAGFNGLTARWIEF